MDRMDKMLDDFETRRAEKKKRNKEEEEQRQKEADKFEAKVKESFGTVVAPLFLSVKRKLEKRGFKCHVDQPKLVSGDPGPRREIIERIRLRVDIDPGHARYQVLSLSFKPERYDERIMVEKDIGEIPRKVKFYNVDEITEATVEEDIRDFLEQILSSAL